MARTMLANQFAVGLRQKIKIKVAGIEGNFEQLLAKAKFEEAKLRDLGGPLFHGTDRTGPDQIHTLFYGTERTTYSNKTVVLL